MKGMDRLSRWSGSLDSLPDAVREGSRKALQLLRSLRRSPLASRRHLQRFISLDRTLERCERLCDRRPLLHSVLNRELGRWAGALLKARRRLLPPPSRKES